MLAENSANNKKQKGEEEKRLLESADVLKLRNSGSSWNAY